LTSVVCFKIGAKFTAVSKDLRHHAVGFFRTM
jgi:hypothetical protein